MKQRKEMKSRSCCAVSYKTSSNILQIHIWSLLQVKHTEKLQINQRINNLDMFCIYWVILCLQHFDGGSFKVQNLYLKRNIFISFGRNVTFLKFPFLIFVFVRMVNTLSQLTSALNINICLQQQLDGSKFTLCCAVTWVIKGSEPIALIIYCTLSFFFERKYKTFLLCRLQDLHFAIYVSYKLYSPTV